MSLRMIPEWRSLAELNHLLLDPVFYGIGVPAGDGKPIVLIPGFMEGDASVVLLAHWLRHVGYRPALAGILVNWRCPRVVAAQAIAAVERSARQSGLKAVLIGHSKGGYVGRAIARLRPDVVSHVIALGSPYQDPLDTNWLVRSWVETAKLWNRVRVPADRTEPDCYEVHCPCGFGDLICGALPADVGYTAIYTREDGVTSWEKCIDLNGVHNIAVPGTHIGLPVNRNVYRHLASILPGIAAQPLPSRPA